MTVEKLASAGDTFTISEPKRGVKYVQLTREKRGTHLTASSSGDMASKPASLSLSSFLLMAILSKVTAEDWLVNPNDILNPRFFPSTLLLEEAKLEQETRSADEESCLNTSAAGDIRDAFLTMDFHRQKMNEYQCRVYVADEILTEFGEIDESSGEVDRRGTPAAPATAANHRRRADFLSDQGSSSYKDWLTRSTLLDDVYRHYDTVLTGQELEAGGEVTGFAVHDTRPGGKTTAFASPPGSYGPPHSYVPHSIGPQAVEEHYIHHYSPGGGGESVAGGGGHGSSSKGLALKDLFDLALTALAFLSFGVFVMNLILTCIMGQQGTTVVMQTTSTTQTATGAGKHRRRRSPEMLLEDELNEMAYRVSQSMEAFLMKKSCLRYQLCRHNRSSRKFSAKNKIWLPLWSFGLSWVSGQVGGDRLANLRGAVLGLGAANCEDIYPTCAPTKKSKT